MSGAFWRMSLMVRLLCCGFQMGSSTAPLGMRNWKPWASDDAKPLRWISTCSAASDLAREILTKPSGAHSPDGSCCW